MSDTTTPSTPAAPAATITAPVAAAPTVTASTALPVNDDMGGTIQNITTTGELHRRLIPKAGVPMLIARLDPTAPAGKDVRQINIGITSAGDAMVTITYKP